MAVNLSKGQKISLDKGMTLALVGLGWDTNRYSGGAEFDLDASAFLLGANGKVRKDEDFIFYGNLKSADGSVTHTGDNRGVTEAVQHDCVIAFAFRTHSHFDNLGRSKRSIQSRINFDMIFNKALHVQLHIRTYMHTEQMTACCHLLRSNPKVRINYKYFHWCILIPKQKQGTSSHVPFSDD